MNRKVGFTESMKYACLKDLQQTAGFASINGINLEYCGYEQCEPGFQVELYARENYVIYIAIKGKGVYAVKNKKYELERGNAVLVYPGEKAVYQADEKEPWNYMWIGFRGYRCEEYITYMGFSKENPIVKIQEIDSIKECIFRMLQAKEFTVEDELMRMGQLLQIMALFMKENQTGEKNQLQDCPTQVYVKYALEYMHMHYKEKIKIDHIADIIGISRSYLTRIFKKELQKSPQEYLIQLRLEYAAKMLKSTAEPINMVASNCGYADSLSFSKAFKRQYGMSPKEYRVSKI